MDYELLEPFVFLFKMSCNVVGSTFCKKNRKLELGQIIFREIKFQVNLLCYDDAKGVPNGDAKGDTNSDADTVLLLLLVAVTVRELLADAVLVELLES